MMVTRDSSHYRNAALLPPSRYYNPGTGRFINADILIATGQGLLGNNMFAYCLNNPVVCADETGAAARVCISADGRIADAPWREHSPSGGGINYHYDGTINDYTGDKFITTIALRYVGKGLKWAWNIYSEGYFQYQQAKMRNSQLLVEGARYLISRPEDALDVIGAAVDVNIAGYALATAVVTGTSTLIVVGAACGFIWAVRGVVRGIQGIT